MGNYAKNSSRASERRLIDRSTQMGLKPQRVSGFRTEEGFVATGEAHLRTVALRFAGC